MADIIKAGIIGLDTSHCRVFTEMFNDEKAKGHVPGVKVVAAYPSFSPDIEKSPPSVKAFEKLLPEKWGVKITASIPELVDQVDAIMIESNDGRRHLAELRAVAAAGKPIFIDKPFAASVADAKEMVRIIREHKLPCFSTSSLRFDSAIRKFVGEKQKHGQILGCDAFAPAHLEKTNPGLFWYGIHGVEILFALIGRGCKTVRCSSTPDGDLAVGVWSDGRMGSMRGIRKGGGDYGATVLCEKTPMQMVVASGDYYYGLIAEMAQFFQTKKPPVPIEDTLEICAFCEAAWKSSQEKCGDVAIDVH